MTLSEGKTNTAYTVTDILDGEKDICNFLFTLGCFPGENVTIISRLASNMIINVRNARYSIDLDLARSIII